MEPSERFAAAVQVPAADVRLDVAALCVAAHAHRGLEVDAWCARLDDLAGECLQPSFDEVRRILFVEHDFRGNTEHYEDPANSLLDFVIARERGLPITLSIVVMEVARRLGVAVDGIGMPGHFLVQESSSSGNWYDPFGGGAVLLYDECAAIFDRIYQGRRALQPGDLSPVSSHAIIARILTNLEHGPLASDPKQLAWMCRLHLLIPELEPTERSRLEKVARSARSRWN